MSAHDDAVKAAAEALHLVNCRVPGCHRGGDGWLASAEAAVAAAAPILLAELQADREAERGRWKAEVERALRERDAVAASHREWEQRARNAEAEMRGMERGREAILTENARMRAERARYDALVADLRALCVNGGFRHTGEQRWFTVGDIVAVIDRIAETAPEEPRLATDAAFRESWGRCKAHRDGECHWTDCPQLRDGEPRATGRHCPLDAETAPEEES